MAAPRFGDDTPWTHAPDRLRMHDAALDMLSGGEDRAAAVLGGLTGPDGQPLGDPAMAFEMALRGARGAAFLEGKELNGFSARDMVIAAQQRANDRARERIAELEMKVCALQAAFSAERRKVGAAKREKKERKERARRARANGKRR